MYHHAEFWEMFQMTLIVSRSPEIVLVPGHALFYRKVPANFFQHLSQYYLNNNVFFNALKFVSVQSFSIVLYKARSEWFPGASARPQG